MKAAATSQIGFDHYIGALRNILLRVACYVVKLRCRHGRRALVRSRPPSTTNHSTPLPNCHPAVGAPSLPVQHGRAAGHPLETVHHCDVTPRIRISRRARRAPTDRLALAQDRRARWLAGVRVGESHMCSRVGWAGAFEAPSYGRCGMVPFISVRVELAAVHRSMYRPCPNEVCRTVCNARALRDSESNMKARRASANQSPAFADACSDLGQK